VLISGNTPPLRRSEIEYYAMLSKVRDGLFLEEEDSSAVDNCTPESIY
jgi:hypothetical protein